MICKILQYFKLGRWEYHRSPNDLTNFRLINKRCAAIGAKELCRSLHVMFTVKSFQNLLNIARDPVLREYVFEVTYDAVLLEKVVEAEYKERVLQEWLDMNSEFDAGEDYEDFEDLTKTMFVDEWKAYKSMLDAQEHLKAFNFDSATFAEAFSHLPNLRSIRIDLDPDTYSIPSSPTYLAYEDTEASLGGLLTGRLEDDELSSRVLGSSILTIPRISKVESLRLLSISWSFFKPPPQGLDPYPMMISKLRYLNLKFQNTERKQVVECHKNLGNALRSSPGLEHIRLCFGTHYPLHDQYNHWKLNVRTTIQDIFGDYTWPKLRTLKIAVLTSSEPKLTSFLRRHVSTLTHLKLESMLLTGSNHGWGRILGLLRNGLTLEKVELAGAWSIDGKGGKTVHENMSVNWVGMLCDAIERKEKVNISKLKSRKDAMGRHPRYESE